MIGYDAIGDVHGQDGKLEALLLGMGYVPHGKGYKAPIGRQALFLGDLIDRGPGQVRVLEVVRSMVESGDALCIMGNHEFNAICYVTDDESGRGECFRPNRIPTAKALKNRAQHQEFLDQVGEGSSLHKELVDWFKTLPPFLDLGGIRAVHGCWDQPAVDTLSAGGWKPGVPLNMPILRAVNEANSPMKEARQLLTCGLELPLPDGKFILGKEGHQFFDVRIANWRAWATQLHEVALVPQGQEDALRGMEWPVGLVISAIQGSPIFVGHHWFSGHPAIESKKLACLDWSAGAGGKLVAYRWDGESELTDNNLFWIGKS